MDSDPRIWAISDQEENPNLSYYGYILNFPNMTVWCITKKTKAAGVDTFRYFYGKVTTQQSYTQYDADWADRANKPYTHYISPEELLDNS